MNTLDKIVEAQKKLLEALITCESEIGNLYGIYSRCFPDKSEFWGNLEKEERKHAELLSESRSQLDHGEIFNGLGQLTPDSTMKLIKYVRERIFEAEHETPLACYAAAVALEIESSIIDSQVFQAIKPSAKALQQVALRLEADTQEHVIQVRAEKMTLDRLRRRNGISPPAPPPARPG
jgi:hypothetical protein